MENIEAVIFELIVYSGKQKRNAFKCVDAAEADNHEHRNVYATGRSRDDHCS